MSATSLLLNHPLPRDAVELGRLVLDPLYPEDDFCQPKAVPDIGTQPLADLVHILDSDRGTSLKLSLVNLFSLSPSSTGHLSTSLSTSTFVGYQLRNSGDYFRRACSEPSVREFVETQAQRRFGKLFLVCGFKTLKDARVQNKRDGGYKLAGGVAVPASLVASAAAGMPLPIPPEADVDIVAAEAEVTQTAHDEAGYTATGEQVFAVQYRRVNFAWFSTKKVESAYLEAGNRWKLYGTLRGEGREDGIEAGLDEGAAAPDLVAGDYESLDLGGEMIVFRASEENEEEEAPEEP